MGRTLAVALLGLMLFALHATADGGGAARGGTPGAVPLGASLGSLFPASVSQPLSVSLPKAAVDGVMGVPDTIPPLDLSKQYGGTYVRTRVAAVPHCRPRLGSRCHAPPP